jgi:hypothetical protein
MLGCRNESVWYQREPTISEILSDSMVKAMMHADGVDPRLLERELRTIAEIVQLDRLAPRSPPGKRGPSDKTDQRTPRFIPAGAGINGECG